MSGVPRWPAASEAADGVRGYVITCRDCPATDFVSNSHGPHLPIEVVGKKFAQRGWEIGNSRAKDRCPACQQARRAEHAARAAKRSAAADSPKDDTMKVNGHPQITPAASAKIAELYLTLDEAYDREKRVYKPGYSDKTIAEKLGLSPDLVTKRREVDFGPLVADTTGEDLRRVIADLQQIDVDIGDLVAKLATRLGERIETTNALAKLAARVGKDG